MDRLGHWFTEHHNLLQDLSRSMNNRTHPFYSSQIPPHLLEKTSTRRLYTDEYGREWYRIYGETRRDQFAIAQLLIASGVPVAPIIQRHTEEDGDCYFSFRFPTSQLEMVANKTREDMWASDMLMRYIFHDTDRSVYEGSEHNIDSTGSTYYLFDFGAADLTDLPYTTHFLDDRMKIFQRDFGGDGIEVINLFRTRLKKIQERLEGRSGLSLLVETLSNSSSLSKGTDVAAERAQNIQHSLLTRIEKALDWTEQYIGK